MWANPRARSATRALIWLAAAAIVVFLAAGNTGAQEPRVIDGDTFEMDGDRIRLHGIDALEISGPCPALSEAATEALRERLAAGAVECFLPPHGDAVDRHGRLVRRCEVGGQDVAAALVAVGLAVDWPRYSGGAYAEAQAFAQEWQQGIWATECRPRWWEE